ncbi:hypothetical protein [Kushneria aurantia]|uniref:Uncharacterized protein n=1 Tax=Kushneria aurantia TaxID=504092 RepID=A0ABV6G4L3_9GAMM|nr:hypothetical protein [Kushneria aurantia]
MQPPQELTQRLSFFLDRQLVAQPLAFEDASNWRWKSESLSPEMIRMARTDRRDPFWHGLDSLFGFDRWQHAENLTRLAGSLPPRLPLLPLPMTWLGRLQEAPIWSLPWRSGRTATMNGRLATLLGEQLGRLHAEPVSGWGHPLSEVRSLESWPQQLAQYLERHLPASVRRELPERVPIPERAVWCLPDLRADQFIEAATDWCWTDWEALVWAPLELDWTLIELLLNENGQQQAFMARYWHFGEPVSIAAHRSSCRALLWSFNCFGPCDWEAVRDAPRWLGYNG